MRNRFVFAGFLFTALVATGCTIETSTDDGVTLTIDNEEAYSIDHIYISPSGFATDDDLLNGFPLDPGDSIPVDGFDCGDYDVEVVDEAPSANDCELTDYNICLDGDFLTIDDSFFADATCTDGRKAGHAPRTAVTTARK